MADSKDILGRFWSALEDSPFILVGIPGQQHSFEPMTAQFARDEWNSLFFFTRRDNRLVQGLRKDSAGMAHFASKGHDLFAAIEGRLSQSDDPQLVDRFWSSGVAAWFDGKDDPQMTLVRFDMESAEMWEAEVGLGRRLRGIFGGKISREEMAGKHIQI